MAELTLAEILVRVQEVYASCRTYQDTGVVETRFRYVHRRGHTSRKPFSTAFSRPDRFRFEWAEATVGPEEEWKRMLILWNSEGVRSSWSIQPGIRTHETFHGALACPTGVSGGSAYTVPTLLLPGGTGGHPLPAPESTTLRGRERVAGHECFGLEHAHEHGGKEVLWIGCDDFLLRRIDQEHVFDGPELARIQKMAEESLGPRAPAYEPPDGSSPEGFRTETTTTYEPVVDAVIEPERFADPAVWPRKDAPQVVQEQEPIRFAPVPSGSPSASELMASVRRAYASCRSYRDSGTMTTVFIHDGPRFQRRTQLQTVSLAFVRPDRLRFESVQTTVGPEDEWSRMILLWNASAGYWRFGLDSKKSAAMVDDIARLGRTFAPVGLLVPVPKEFDPLPSADAATLLGRQTLDEHECFVVAGCPPTGEERMLWIGHEDFLVRRVRFTNVFDERWYGEQRARMEEELKRPLSAEARKAAERALEHYSSAPDPFRTETTITLAPEVDIAIPEELFETPDSQDQGESSAEA